MHEYSVVRSILKQVQQSVGREACDSVRQIHICVGEFSGVDPDLLQIAFDLVVSESEQPHRQLVVRRTPLCAECEACGTEFAPVSFVFCCPACGSTGTNIVRGEELVLESITLQE